METQCKGFCVPVGQLTVGCRAELKRYCTHKHILIKYKSVSRISSLVALNSQPVSVCVCVCALICCVGTFVFQEDCGDSSYGFVGLQTGNEFLGEDIRFG